MVGRLLYEGSMCEAASCVASLASFPGGTDLLWDGFLEVEDRRRAVATGLSRYWMDKRCRDGYQVAGAIVTVSSAVSTSIS